MKPQQLNYSQVAVYKEGKQLKREELMFENNILAEFSHVNLMLTNVR